MITRSTNTGTFTQIFFITSHLHGHSLAAGMGTLRTYSRFQQLLNIKWNQSLYIKCLTG